MAPPKSPNERKVNSVRPFSNITSHIDPMVLYTFMALLIISVAILAFKAGTHQDCSNMNIAFSSRLHGVSTSYTVGEVITFNAKNTGDARSSYNWNFGDSSAQQLGQQVYHAFAEAGNYTITLQAGKCSRQQDILVVNPPPVNTTAPVADIYPVIEGPEEAFVGKPATYRNSTPGATSWEWRLQQPNAETHQESSHTYTFSTPGERIVTLVVNGDSSRMVKKRVQVFPAPVYNRPNDNFVPPPFPTQETKPETATTPLPEKPKVPSISDDEFRVMLTQLNNKQKTAQDFSPYLCNNLNARVLLNDKDVKTFNEFCNAIRGKKRVKIEMVNLIKDPEGCVKEIRIRYDKKGFLGIF